MQFLIKRFIELFFSLIIIFCLVKYTTFFDWMLGLDPLTKIQLMGNDANIGSACATPWGNVVRDGEKTLAYQASQVESIVQCRSEMRVCANGTLDGSYHYNSCSIDQTALNKKTSWSSSSSLIRPKKTTSYWNRTVKEITFPGQYTKEEQESDQRSQGQLESFVTEKKPYVRLKRKSWIEAPSNGYIFTTQENIDNATVTNAKPLAVGAKYGSTREIASDTLMNGEEFDLSAIMTDQDNILQYQ